MRTRPRSGRLRAGALVELVSLAVLATGGGIVAWLVGDDPRSAPHAGISPAPVDLPGLPDSTAPVLLPGCPGEAARTAGADTVTPLPRLSYNATDVRFATMMIPHHEQALVMARLAPERAENPRIKAIAERILAGQGPEIAALDDWLVVRGLSRASDGGQHPHAMAGMQSAEALNALAAARGAVFDRMFVEMMTDHHRGAIAMAREAQALGVDGTINELAGSVSVEQNAEIGRLREALTTP